MTEKILRREDIKQLTGLSYSTIWRLENADQFPQIVQLSANCFGWVESEVLDWIQERIDKRTSRSVTSRESSMEALASNAS